ncbi:hypothetical protein [Ruminiclostridium josui]|nr:hypothetical protein [Ruminiclostridium josui]
MNTGSAVARKSQQSSNLLYSNSQKKSSVSKTASKKPNVRVTEFSQIVALLLNDPDSVTRDEFMFFQSKLGYSQTVRLMTEGRKRKQMVKQGKEIDQKKSSLTLIDNTKDTKESNKDINKPQEEKTSSTTEVKSLSSEETSKPKAEKKQETPDSHYVNTTKDKNKENSHTGKYSQVKQTTQKQTKETVKQKTDTKSSAQLTNANTAKTVAVKTQENTQIKQKAQTKAATPDKKQSEKKQQQKAPAPSFGKEIAAIASATAPGQKAKKTPEVKIKGGDPGSLLSQLENVPPTQALNAYSQVTALSGEALKNQTQKTQNNVPQIKAPTGITAISKSKKTKKPLKTFNHAVPTSFKAEKTGKAQDGAKNFDININSEAEPDEIMAQAKLQTANTPGVEFTGEADPSQMEGYNAEMSQNVQAAKQQELEQIQNDFGENNIFPDEDNTILKAKKALKGTTAKAYKAPKTLEIPVEMEAQLNKTLGPKMKTKLTEQKEKYQTGREKFDSDVKAARAESDSRIMAMKAETSKKQMEEQKGAQAEVERQRKQWRQEIDGAVAEYDKQAEAETKNKTKEINKIKEEKNKEIKEKMAKAESDANQECKTAKKKAEDKKKEHEKEKEKEDKPWYAKAIDWVKDKAQKFIEGLKKALNFIFDALRKAVKVIFDLAKKAINGLIELGRRMIVGLIKGLGAFLKGLVKIVFAKFPGISKKICGFIDKTVDKAVNKVNALADSLKKGVNSVLDFLSGTLDKLLGVVQSIYNGILTFTGMLISGQFAEIMEGIKALGEAAKASLPHIEGKVWEQLLGVDLTQPMEDQAAEGGQPQGQTVEKLTENDIVIEQVEKGEITPELLEDINLKDGETRELQGSSNPHTTESIMEEFDTQKTGNSFGDGLKTRAQNAEKILDQIKQFVIKWLKDNWWKLLLGVLGALAGIIAAEIVTGGAITAALPVIINAITTAMNAAMVVSIIDTIAKAAGYIETYLTQGWARHIQPAAIALATALAMGLVELAMALGFKLAGKGIKAAKSGIKKGIKTTAKGAKKLATTVGKGIKSLLKSGAKLVSKTGSMIIENGKIIIKSLKKGFSKGIKKLNGLIDKILSKFRFKKFKIERKGRHIRIYGEVNPWVLLYDGTIEKIDRKNTHAGDIIEHEGKRGIVLTRNTKPTAKVNELYENALKNGGKVEVKGGSKTDVLANNRAQGKAFEQQEFSNFNSNNTNAVEQITIKTSSGTKTRVDAIGLDANGNVVINEFKSSATAPLTPNQKIAFPELFSSGGTVVGKGKGIFTGGYQIPSGTEVKIVRPQIK